MCKTDYVAFAFELTEHIQWESYAVLGIGNTKSELEAVQFVFSICADF